MILIQFASWEVERANQWTGFYMITASAMKELMENLIFCAVPIINSWPIFNHSFLL